MTALQHRLAFCVLLVAGTLPALPADLPNIPNFHVVNNHVFRGGQPSDQAWPGLAQLGVKLVIDLRREDEHSSAAEGQAVHAAGMKYVNVPMKGVVSPGDDQVSRLLTLLNSQDSVFIHCKRGADRTGAVIACYRIEHDHWDSKRALSEAKSFGMSWDQFGLKRYVKAFRPMPDRVAEDFSAVEKSQ